MEDEILRDGSGRKRTLDLDGERLRHALRQRLGGEHVLDLRGPDAERERAERAVRRGVRVTTDDHRTRLSESELRTDHVHDALVPVTHPEQRDAELLGVTTHRLHLRGRQLVLDRQEPADLVGRRRHVVVHRGERQIGTTDRAAGDTQALERLRRGDLVHQMEVDVEQIRLALGTADEVLLPDLLDDGARSTHHGSLGTSSDTAAADSIGRPLRRGTPHLARTVGATG